MPTIPHNPVVNPAAHYLGIVGFGAMDDHSQCIAQWERIKAERADEYGPDGAYSHGGCVHGQRFEGRGWDRDSAANGQQGGIDYNPGSRAFCMMVGTDDPIPASGFEVTRLWANEAVARGMEWPLRSHSEFVATMCCGDPMRGIVDLVNLLPGGYPGGAPTLYRESEFEMVRWGKNFDGSTFAVNWNGSYISDRFSGAPNPLFGVPEDALAFAGASIPVRLCSPIELGIMEGGTKAWLKAAGF